MTGKMQIRSKTGQTTIFIIAAVIIVGVIILFFILRGKQVIDFAEPDIAEPQEYIDKCTEDASREAIDILLAQGGYIVPENHILYKDDKIAYLCYNKNYYQTCIAQEPIYIQHLEQEIKNYIEPKIEDCFYALEQEYRSRNYDFDLSGGSLGVELKPKQVRVEINRKLTLTKNEETRRFEEFKTRFSSPIYDLAVIAQEIVNQEAKFCYFEYLGFSLLYLPYSVEKTEINGEAKIYTIIDKTSNKKLIFAVRSCAFPPGF